MAELENRHPGKLRLRAVSECGEPIAGMRVELVSIRRRDSRSDGKAPAEIAALRALSTSRDGFAIFSLEALPPAARACGDLAVRFGERSELTFDLDRDATAAGSHYSSYTLPDGPWLEVKAPGRWHDDGLEADDFWAIPGLFPDLGDLEFGDEYCGRLIPGDLTVRIADHSRLVRTARDAVTCLAADEGGCRNCGGLIEQGEGGDDRTVRLHERELIHFQIKCARLGYSFGDLLYSLPLAPCESVTLAVSNWEQRQRARAEQESVSEETRSASYHRRNALSETLDAASSGNHHQWGVKAGVVLKKISLGIGGGGSYDRTKFASKATREFTEKIQQSSEAWRRDHQVVVMEQSETEDHRVSQRTVCNNNHCHVLNIFYHEVLDNYRVTTTMKGHREVYLVPYEVKEFDLHMAVCARALISPHLLDPSLSECYSKLRLPPAISVAEPPKDTPKEDKKTLLTQFRVDINIEAADASPNLDLHLVIRLSNGPGQDIPVIRNDVWQTGRSFSYLVPTPNINLNDITDVGISVFNIATGWIPNFRIRYNIFARTDAASLWHNLGGKTESSMFEHLGSMVPVRATPAASPPPPPPIPTPPPPAADDRGALEKDCADRLLGHLNCHKFYYNSLLWLLEDPNERFCRFDRIKCGPSGTSLADLVIPEPLGLMGCHVAFAKADDDYVPHDGEPVVAEQLLTLPTPGIFADAALGQCSACETIDRDVYWDWKDTPCACGAKTVQLKNPAESPLFPAGMLPFATLPAAAWAAGVAPPGDSVSNSLIATFGAALAAALLPGKDSGKDVEKELAALQALLAKMLEAAKDAGKGEPPKPEGPKAAERKPARPK